MYSLLNRAVATACLLFAAGLGYAANSGAIAPRAFHEPLIVNLTLLGAFLWLLQVKFSTNTFSRSIAGVVVFYILVWFPAQAIGVANIGLAWKAADLLSVETLWATLLAIPGFLAVIHLFVGKPEPPVERHDKSRSDQATNDKSENLSEATWFADRSKTTFFAPIRKYGTYGVMAVFVMFLFAGALYFSRVSYLILEEAIFNNRFEGWWPLPPTIFSLSLLGQFAVIGLGGFVLLVSIGVTISVWRAVLNWGIDDVDREFSTSELRYFDGALTKIRNYLGDYEAPKWFGRVSLLQAVALIAALFVFLTYMTEMNFGSEYFGDLRTTEQVWFIYSDAVGGAELAMYGLLLLIGLIWFPGFVGSIYKPLGISQCISELSKKADPISAYDGFREKIAFDIRRHVLQPTFPFDAETYIHFDHVRSTNRLATLWGLILVAGAGIWALERADYTLIHPAGIVDTDFWTLERHQFAYDDVDRVEVTCIAREEDGPVIGYEFILDSDRRIPVVYVYGRREFRDTVPSVIEAWETVDDIIRTKNIPVAPVPSIRQGDTKACTDEILEMSRSGLGDRVVRLLASSS